MFERRSQPVASRGAFVRRMLAWFALSLAVIVAALGIGIAGYHWVAGLPWVDALLNASMILAGMGPVDPLATTGAKLFASCYALFSGLVFISVLAMLMTPVVHRILHKFHLDEQDLEK
jgi:hypothetical protein